MSTKLTTRTPTARPDWHSADIVAAVRKAGSSLRQLSLDHGYSQHAMKRALAGPWPKAERIIADFIGISPDVIWPSRYGTDGQPNRRRGRRKICADGAMHLAGSGVRP